MSHDISSESDHNALQHKNNCLSDIGVSDELIGAEENCIG